MRFMRFTIAGAGGFIVQLATLAVLVAAHMHYVAATIIAVEAAIVINFLWHERWTWRDRTGSSGALTRFLKFNALTAATSIIGSVVITAILVEYFTFSPMLANVISVIVLSVINFVGADSIVFRATATLALVMLVVSASAAQASTEEATLQAKTKADFAKYVAAVEARRTRDIANHEPFLDVERLPAAQLASTLASLKRGEVIVTRGG